VIVPSPECLAIGIAEAVAKRIVFAACRKIASARKLGGAAVIDAPEDAAAIHVAVKTEKNKMKTNKTTNGTGTHTASFRISAEQRHDFLELLEAIPGADVGNMYRAVFERGLKSLRTFYAQQGLLPQEQPGGEQS
jgi:hypothetical protein